MFIIGLNDQESTRRRRLPFSIDLNQMLIDEIQAVDSKLVNIKHFY